MTRLLWRLIPLIKAPMPTWRTPRRGFILVALLLVLSATTLASDPSATQPSVNQPNTLQYKAQGPGSGQALVSGTSTLHDWTVKSGTINGNALFLGQWKPGSTPAISLQSISLTIPVDSIKSTEGGGMDKTMYDALNLQQFPTMTYRLTKASLKKAPSKQSSEYQFDTTGELTVAGATHLVSLILRVLPHDNEGLTITTDIGLKMTDFGIKPPTAMLGFIKSGDQITVKLTWQLTVQPHIAGAPK